MRRSIVITNKTDFDTRTLRSIIIGVARKYLKPTEYKGLEVTFGTPRSAFVTGSAVINKGGITAVFTVNIPKNQSDVVEVCQRIKTCLDYVKGGHGGSNGMLFRDWYQRSGKAGDFPFAQHIVLAAGAKSQPGKKLTGAASAMQKAEYAQEKVHEWERKSKLAKTMLKKWKKQLKYHSTRGDKLHTAAVESREQTQGMTVEEFLKMPPVRTT